MALKTRRPTGRPATAPETPAAATPEQYQAVFDALVAAGYHKPSTQRHFVNSVLGGQVRSFRDLTGAMCEAVPAALAELPRGGA